MTGTRRSHGQLGAPRPAGVAGPADPREAEPSRSSETRAGLPCQDPDAPAGAGRGLHFKPGLILVWT